MKNAIEDFLEKRQIRDNKRTYITLKKRRWIGAIVIMLVLDDVLDKEVVTGYIVDETIKRLNAHIDVVVDKFDSREEVRSSKDHYWMVGKKPPYKKQYYGPYSISRLLIELKPLFINRRNKPVYGDNDEGTTLISLTPRGRELLLKYRESFK